MIRSAPLYSGANHSSSLFITRWYIIPESQASQPRIAGAVYDCIDTRFFTNAMTLLLGRELKSAFAVSVLALENWRETINSLNVFPVPDGDTGTNMLLTLRAAVDNVPESPEITAGELLEALAD